jgi:hypothetical protein
VFVRAEVSEIVLDDAGKVTHHVTVVCGWWCGVRDVVRYANCIHHTTGQCLPDFAIVFRIVRQLP